MENYQHISVNIRKLLKYFEIDVNTLAERSGISVAGIRKMLSTTSFKVENLDKIGNVFKVPIFALLSKELFLSEETDEIGQIRINLVWAGGEVENEPVNVRGKNALLSVQYANKVLEKLYEGKIKEYREKWQNAVSELSKIEMELSNVSERNKFLTEQIEFYKFKSENMSDAGTKTIAAYEKLLIDYGELLKKHEEIVTAVVNFSHKDINKLDKK